MRSDCLCVSLAMCCLKSVAPLALMDWRIIGCVCSVSTVYPEQAEPVGDETLWWEVAGFPLLREWRWMVD